MSCDKCVIRLSVVMMRALATRLLRAVGSERLGRLDAWTAAVCKVVGSNPDPAGVVFRLGLQFSSCDHHSYVLGVTVQSLALRL